LAIASFGKSQIKPKIGIEIDPEARVEVLKAEAIRRDLRRAEGVLVAWRAAVGREKPGDASPMADDPRQRSARLAGRCACAHFWRRGSAPRTGAERCGGWLDRRRVRLAR
jgi:hypothetical protein